MSIYFGNKPISSCYVSNKAVERIYCGSVMVWPEVFKGEITPFNVIDIYDYWFDNPGYESPGAAYGEVTLCLKDGYDLTNGTYAVADISVTVGGRLTVTDHSIEGSEWGGSEVAFDISYVEQSMSKLNLPTIFPMTIELTHSCFVRSDGEYLSEDSVQTIDVDDIYANCGVVSVVVKGIDTRFEKCISEKHLYNSDKTLQFYPQQVLYDENNTILLLNKIVDLNTGKDVTFDYVNTTYMDFIIL